MHGVTGKPAATDSTANATPRIMLLLLVAMTGVAPISLYMLVPALPVLATAFGRDVSIAQMTVSLYMSGSPVRKSSWARCRIGSDAARCCWPVSG